MKWSVAEVEGVAEGLGLGLVELGRVLAGEDLAAEGLFKVGGQIEALRAGRAAHVEFHFAVRVDDDFDFLDLHRVDYW
jgi:hypothetical protein